LERLAHVGDSAADDLEGARQAGMTALHLQRDLPRPPRDAPVITSLVEIADRIV
jgi:FMN phosphatase YigB (HAD superfamily)